MTRRASRSALRLLSVALAVVVAVVAFSVVKNLGWLTPFGIKSESHDTQVITAIKRTQEVSLVSLRIQGIKEEDKNRTVFGIDVPLSGEKTFLEYNFTAKLGIDGAQVRVSKTAEDAYLISVPEFTFIGYDQPTFKVAIEDGGLLSWVTPDIDEVAMVNEILNEDERQEYVDSNEALLKEQTKVFYDGIVTSVDPSAVTKYEFR